MQPSAPRPHALPINLQDNDNEEHRSSNRSLGPETLLRPSLRRPANLQITDDKAAQRPALIQPRANLAGTFRVAIEIVAGDGDGRDHDAEDVEAPSERGYHVMIPPLKAEAEEDKAGNHERCGEPDDGKAGFGLEDTVVAAHVDATCEVVHPVAGHETDESGNDGGEVEEAYSRTSERSSLVGGDRD
jgi:hypothetical protein